MKVKSMLPNINGKTNTNRLRKIFSSKMFCIRNSYGLSLISTLWILTILSVLAMQLLYSFELETKAQRNFLEREKYHYAAKAGFEWGIAKLRMDETNFDSLGETWAAPVQQQIEDGIQIGRMLNYQVTITDEGARIDINAAEEDQIRNLLSFLGAQPENNPTGDLATRIVEGRPYRTLRDVARVEGMTQDILYGIQMQAPVTEEDTNQEKVTPQRPTITTTSAGGLVNTATIYSVDANTDSGGQQRTNINSANAQQISQIRSKDNQSIFSQGEANALIQKREYDRLSTLLDVQVITDQVFNNIRNDISVEDAPVEESNFEENNNEGEDGGEDGEGFGGGRNNNGGNNGDSKTNINTADSDELQELQGIDQGIAQRIIEHRNSQGNFQNIEAIRDVKLMTVQELAQIADRITAREEQTVNGLININTAPIEILQLLPGMDQAKARAIITRREENNQELQNNSEQPIQGNPFTDIGQLLEIDEIDEQTFREIVDWITYRSNGYRIESSAVDINGKIIAKCVGVVVRDDTQFSVPYWRQD